jgi:hypothetical protein
MDHIRRTSVTSRSHGASRSHGNTIAQAVDDGYSLRGPGGADIGGRFPRLNDGFGGWVRGTI